jgi:hypothetical protein
MKKILQKQQQQKDEIDHATETKSKCIDPGNNF